jgi:hypothetical protein
LPYLSESWRAATLSLSKGQGRLKLTFGSLSFIWHLNFARPVKFLPGEIFTPPNSCFQQCYPIGEVAIQLGLNDYFIGALALFHWGILALLPIFHGSRFYSDS